MIALTFLCGFAIEAVAVYWVHFAERGHAWRAGAFSASGAASSANPLAAEAAEPANRNGSCRRAPCHVGTAVLPTSAAV